MQEEQRPVAYRQAASSTAAVQGGDRVQQHNSRSQGGLARLTGGIMWGADMACVAPVQGLREVHRGAWVPNVCRLVAMDTSVVVDMVSAVCRGYT